MLEGSLTGWGSPVRLKNTSKKIGENEGFIVEIQKSRPAARAGDHRVPADDGNAAVLVHGAVPVTSGAIKNGFSASGDRHSHGVLLI
jgi:hypothetical protein